jgi:hypothetical protein
MPRSKDPARQTMADQLTLVPTNAVAQCMLRWVGDKKSKSAS